MRIKDSLIEIHSLVPPGKQLKIIVLSCLTVFLFLPVILKLISSWNASADYSHGFFVIPIFLFMLWQKRYKIIEINTLPTWAGFPLLLFGSVSYLVAFLTSFHTLTDISIIIIILSLVLFLTGWQSTKLFIFPVLFLLFMFPIPSAFYILITNPLKLLITTISAGIINICGISVYQEGNLLFFANTQLEIAEACSGIRSLYSYLMLSCVFSLLCRNLSSKVILILSTIPLAIVVNIVRVSGTGILANYFGSEVAQGFFHEFAGFILFIIGFVVLLGIYNVLEHRKVKT